MPETISERRLEEIWERPHSLWGWLASVDHKEIGHRYIATAVLFLLVGGIEALILRLQLARPDQTLVTPEVFNQIFTMHGATMIYWYAAPILSGFANYLIPLMIGARDMAFPRANAVSYWMFLFSGLMLYGSAALRQSPDGGWFAYTPMTNAQYSPGLGLDFFAFSLIFLTISTTVGAINFIVTIFRLRAPGMADQPDAAVSLQHDDNLVRHRLFTPLSHGRMPVSRIGSKMGNSLFRSGEGR